MMKLLAVGYWPAKASLLSLGGRGGEEEGVVRNYVPRARYSRSYVPCTLETMYYVPQARNHVPSTLETMYFHKKFDKKVE